MKFVLGSFPVSRLDDREDFRISYHPAAGPLPGAEQFGVVTPILISGTRVVCGFRRVLAARSAGLQTIPALEVSDVPDQQLVLLSLLERLSHGPLNEIEKARAASRFQNAGWAPHEIGQTLFPLLGLKFNEMVRQHLSSLLELDDSLQQRVALGEILPHTAVRLHQWAPHEQRIAGWFDALRLSVSRQRELLEMLDEARRTSKREPAALLDELEAMAPGAEPARRIEQWMRHLRILRYPRLQQYETRFETARSALGLPPQIQLAAPPNFEEGRYRIALTFQSREELERHCRKLLEIAGGDEMGTILELI